MHTLEALGPVAAIQPARAGGSEQDFSGVHHFFAQLAPGQRLHATVHSRISGAEVAVMLNTGGGTRPISQAVRMTLPPDVQPGDHLKLVFIGREPRPRFSLIADLAPRTDFFKASATGRFIDDLLRNPPVTDRFFNGAVTPLLDGAPDDPIELSSRLAQALGRSGLFYESHVAQWVEGKRTLAELMQEPQAGFPSSRREALTIETGNQAGRKSATSLEPASITENSVRLHRHIPEQFQNESLALVRQQLDVLETRQIAWQGEAWPGQMINLKFFEEDPDTRADPGHTGEGPVNSWKTHLCLTLPNLGEITADLRLHDQGAQVNLSASSAGAAATLRSGITLLSQGLESGGVTLLSIGVNLREETGAA